MHRNNAQESAYGAAVKAHSQSSQLRKVNADDSSVHCPLENMVEFYKLFFRICWPRAVVAGNAFAWENTFSSSNCGKAVNHPLWWHLRYHRGYWDEQRKPSSQYHSHDFFAALVFRTPCTFGTCLHPRPLPPALPGCHLLQTKVLLADTGQCDIGAKFALTGFNGRLTFEMNGSLVIRR